jgi:formimidoylglutamate deiminase
MTPRKLHVSQALLPGGVASGVTIAIGADGRIAAVAIDDGQGGERVSGLALPGMANVHSHAHQRAIAGLTERSGTDDDSFWTWREAMYRFALTMNPDEFQAIATQAYIEMAKAGYTAVGEFHYLHHQPDGSPYANPAELGLRCLAAAEASGLAITLLPTLYMQGGFGGAPPQPGQRRFLNSLDSFHTLIAALPRSQERAVHGISLHSLRAVSIAAMKQVLAEATTGPVHLHIAEQTKEVEDCLAATGRRPVELLLDNVDLTRRWCLIHGTHLTSTEMSRLSRSGATVGLCPITEANLGDGIFPARDYCRGGGAIAIGSDSNVEITVAGELRMLEYSQRLQHRARNVLAGGPHRSTGRVLYELASSGGATALGQAMGALAVGNAADIVILDLDHPALIGRRGEAIIDSFIFAGGNAAVRDVFVSGRQVVLDGHHIDETAARDRFRRAISSLAGRE